MNEAQQNQYLELDSVKTESKPTIYDDVVAESSPGVEQTSYETSESQEAVKKKLASADLENACQRDMVLFAVDVILNVRSCCCRSSDCNCCSVYSFIRDER